MRKESKEMAVTAATMKKEKRNEPAVLLLITWRAGTRTNVFRIQPAAVRLLTTTG